MRKSWTAVLLAAVMALGCAGCGSKSDDTVAVQSVASLCGLTKTLQSQVYAGVVSTGNEANIKKDSTKAVAKVNVKKGDIVKEGDVLFTYDAEQAENSLEKGKLELEELKNTLTAKQDEKKELETEKSKASQDSQLEYTLKIQEVDTDIRETEYNIKLKESEIKKLEDGTKNLDVTAPFAGRIEYAGTADTSSTDYSFSLEDEGMDDVVSLDSDDSSEGSAFIKIVETDNYRVKGSIDESNVSQITEGVSMIIHSRIDSEKTWQGIVTQIDIKNPSKTSSGSYDDDSDSELTTTTKYPFYVKIDTLEGLMIGQHVYMTLDTGEEEPEIRLPSGYINDIDSEPWVWAERNGVLEKRSVEIDEYEPSEDSWLISDGLYDTDYIAFPASNLAEGLPVVENDLASFEVTSDDTSGDLDDESEEDEEYEEDFEDLDEEDFEDEDEEDEVIIDAESFEDFDGEVVG